MTTKKRLGRGLDALLGTTQDKTDQPPLKQNKNQLNALPIDQLQRGQYQPRTDMRQEKLEELANSIKSQGIVQPLVVRVLKHEGETGPRYEIIAGERRWRAAQIAGLKDVPVVIRDVPDSDAIAMSLIENIQRENLNPLEEAIALNRLIREFDLTHQQAAEAVGRSRAAVSNLLRLLELSEGVASLLKARKIEMGHARALLSIKDLSLQSSIAAIVVKKGLSVRATEALARKAIAQKSQNKPKQTSQTNPDITRLEIAISEKLGAKLNIDHKEKGNGRIIINYNTLDELEGILTHLK